MTKRTVLLVEDNSDDRMFAQLAFKEFGFPFKVAEVVDGEAAWELLNRPAASRLAGVILDLNIPKVSGLDILRRISAHKALSGLPVVVLTSSDDPKDVSTARALGVRDYMIKPFNFSELKGLVARMTEIFSAGDGGKPE